MSVRIVQGLLDEIPKFFVDRTVRLLRSTRLLTYDGPKIRFAGKIFIHILID
jgi:hypothetical protein